jgi:hypothetical protein
VSRATTTTTTAHAVGTSGRRSGGLAKTGDERDVRDQQAQARRAQNRAAPRPATRREIGAPEAKHSPRKTHDRSVVVLRVERSANVFPPQPNAAVTFRDRWHEHR